MMPIRLLTTCAIILIANPLCAQPPTWRLVWQDQFERSETGDEWFVYQGQAALADGQLKLAGAGATVLVDRPFAPDVRLEFDAQADPNRPPCDLSVALAAGKPHGYHYLLAFGGKNNRVNQLLGTEQSLVDETPPFLIRHGKRYHMIAQKEGRRISYVVDGVEILAAETKYPLGGPGFDRVGFVTWSGMIVDNVKVFERVPPSPDTPRYVTSLPGLPLVRSGRKLEVAEGIPGEGLRDAIESFNRGDIETAARRFRALRDPLLSAAGLAFCYGDLGYQEKEGDFDSLAAAFDKLASDNPSDLGLRDYAAAAKDFRELKISWGRKVPAMRLVVLGPINNPFYYKAMLFQARYIYWEGAEGGRRDRMKQAVGIMAELKNLWPQNPVLREYTGEAVPWGEELNADLTLAPAWAAYLREAYSRQVRILDWWFQHRQSPDGQLGGGWGDDVELLRSWVPAAAISTATESITCGIERMCEGLWNGVLLNGYDPGIGDVEHSAEPSADSLPTMLLLRYGDPRYVEWNLTSARTVRDVMTGKDAKGFVRFKSAEMGALGVHEHPRAGGDTGYHARAMKHALWLAWWGNQEAEDFFLGWVDGWRAATVSTIDTKIPGFVPPSIWYPSGDIFPPNSSSWYDPDWNYYGCPGIPHKILDSFLTAYALSGDPKFLEPFQLMMDLASRGPLLSTGDFPRGSREWQIAAAAHQASPDATALYRWLTGESVYDEYTRRFGKPAQLFRIDHDLDALARSIESLAKGMRANFALRTSEVIATDRAGLAGDEIVFGAYTGGILNFSDAAFPTMAVTYESADTDFAAVVTEATQRRLRVRLFSFHDVPFSIGLRLWRLLPGEYVFSQGEVLPGEHPFQSRYAWDTERTVKILHRGTTVHLKLPPGKDYVVDLRLKRLLQVPSRSPDLAIAPRDLSLKETGGSDATVSATIHNIGNADTGPFDIVLQLPGEGQWTDSARLTLPGLPRPRDLLPQTASISFTRPLSALRDGYRIVIDPEDHVFEVLEKNNSASAKPPL
jgi:hypothetical protein